MCCSGCSVLVSRRIYLNVCLFIGTPHRHLVGDLVYLPLVFTHLYRSFCLNLHLTPHAHLSPLVPNVTHLSPTSKISPASRARVAYQRDFAPQDASVSALGSFLLAKQMVAQRHVNPSFAFWLLHATKASHCRGHGGITDMSSIQAF